MASAPEAIAPSSTASDAPTLYETTFEAEFAGVNFSKPPDEQPS